jgi:predicted permease
MRTFGYDLRHALRLLVKQPLTTATVLVTLAFGLGVNTAMFAVVHAVLLRPLPYQDPERLVMVWEQRPAEDNFTNPVSPADFLDWGAMSQSFDGVAAYYASTVDLTGAGDPVQLTLGGVTAPFFDVLGVAPALGRFFHPGEDVLGQHRVAVLSHRIWQQRFGRDPSIIGRSIVLNGVPNVVIGVLRSDFEFPGESVDIWAPMTLRGGMQAPPRAAHYLQVYARLKPGVSIEQAYGEMLRIGEQLSAAYPVENDGHGPRVVSLREQIVGEARTGLLLVMGAVAFLMLIACTNVTTLLLARSEARRREMAIRQAIGAGRWRLLRQSFTETFLLAALGAALGVLVAWWTLQVLVVETPPALRGAGLERARLDLPVLLFTLLACFMTAGIAGLLPAWQVAAPESGNPIREIGGRSPLSLRRSVRILLVGGQVAMTVLLLIGAGLLARTFLRVLSQPAGVETANRLTVNLTLPRVRYTSAEAIRQARRALDERFSSVPGVIAVGENNNLPLTGSDSRSGITVEGLVRTPGDDPVRAHTRIVSVGYFAAAGIQLHEGRLLSASDDERAPMVIVINETMARRYWPGQSAIGKRIRFNSENEPWREVVGVIRDVKHWGLDREVNPELYMPHDQQPSVTLTYVLHTAGNPLSVIPAITEHVKAVDRDLPLGAVRTFNEIAARSLAARRWAASLLAVFAIVGLVLAAAGIYGVMSHLVALRTGEISIRLSLGARPVAILRQVISDAALNTVVGLALGLTAAVATAGLLQSLLFEVPPIDPVTFGVAAVVNVTVALLAALAPAIRAMQVDPVQALKLGS